MLGTEVDDDHDPALQVHKAYEFSLAVSENSTRELSARRGGKGAGNSSRKQVATAVFYHEPTGRLFVGLDNGELRFWKLGAEGAGAGCLVGTHKGAVTCVHVAHESDGDLGAAGIILSGSYDAAVKLWDYQGKIYSSPTVLVQTLYGHGGTVTCVQTHGDYIITGSTDCTVRLWHAEDGRKELLYPWFELQSTLVTMEGWVRCMVFSRPKDVAHGEVMFAADDAGGVVQITIEGVVDPDICRPGKLKYFRVDGRVAASNGTMLAFRKAHDRGIAAISHDVAGEMVFTLAYDNCLRVYDSTPGTVRQCWANENNCLFTGLHYEPTVKQVITVDQQGFMAIYSLTTNSLVATKRLAPHALSWVVPCIAPHTYAVALSNGEIQVWRIDHELGHDVARGGHTKEVISLYACSGGVGVRSGEMDFRMFSASVDNTIRLWDPYDMSCVRVMEEEQAEVSAMTFFEGWNTVVTGHDNGDIRLWNLDSGSATTLQQHTNTVTALVMAIVRRNEELLVSAGYDGLICIWDVRSMRFQRPHLVDKIQTNALATQPGTSAVTAPPPPASSSTYNTSTSTSCAGSGGGSSSSSSILHRLAASSEILCLEYDPMKKLIISGGNDRCIKVWSALNLELCGAHRGHRDSVTCLALDGNFLFSGSEDTTIHMWDVLPPQGVAAHKPSDLPQSAPLLVLRGHERTVTGVRVHAMHGHLLSCSSDGELRIWNYTKGQPLYTFHHHEQFRCLAVRYDKDEALVGTAEANILRFPLGSIPLLSVPPSPPPTAAGRTAVAASKGCPLQGSALGGPSTGAAGI